MRSCLKTTSFPQNGSVKISSETAVKEAGISNRVSFMEEYLASLCEALGFDPSVLPGL